jgi:hypothetical protein
MEDKTIPEGYKQNAAGHLVPVEAISELDKTRDELVMELVAKAKGVNSTLTKAKTEMMADIGAFVELSAEKYGAKVGGNKGNVTLLSFDGRFKVVRSVQDMMVFDERINAAKAKVDECIHNWSQGSRVEIKALIEHAFQVDKQGNISTARVFGLLRLDINDVNWQEAMKALRDSIQVVASKSYVRVYERETSDTDYKPIPMDISAA